MGRTRVREDPQRVYPIVVFREWEGYPTQTHTAGMELRWLAIHVMEQGSFKRFPIVRNCNPGVMTWNALPFSLKLKGIMRKFSRSKSGRRV